MELGSYTKTLISIAVVVIIIMAMAIPTMIGSINPRESNDCYYTGTKLDVPQDDTQIVLKITNSTGGKGTESTGTLTGGSAISKTITFSGPDKPGWLFAGDGGTISYCRDGDTSTSWSPVLVVAGNDGTYRVENTSNSVTFYITLTQGSVYISKGSQSLNLWSFSSSWLIVPNDGGDWAGLCMSSGTYYNYTEFYGSAWIDKGATAVWVGFQKPYYTAVATGSPASGEITGSVRNIYDTDGKTYPLSITSIDTPKIGSRSMQVGDITVHSDDYTRITEMNLAYVPLTYYMEDEKYGSTKTLLNMIPLLMITGLMVAVVAAYAQWKKEE